MVHRNRYNSTRARQEEPDGRSQRHAKSERRCARIGAAPHDERDALNDSLHALLGIQLTSSWQSGKTYTTDPGGGAPTLNVKETLSLLARFEHLMGMAAFLNQQTKTKRMQHE